MAKEEMDKRSFENIVWFYRDELAQVTEGTRATELFPKGLRRRLLGLGVLVYRRGRSGLRYILSATAQELLQTLASGAPTSAGP
ncbi:MAG: hypothetical protein NWE88_06155 [Candidatus Bathyarchaeota archaeon]|nr:hypothetical protein [Candidatus Bathyarchaeota archaeon]